MSILGVIITLLILNVLVIAHEFGHLFAARSIGVQALSFSVGMGPIIARKRFKYFGDTEFRLSLFPIGGYVMVSGEAEDSDDPNSLYKRSPWQRMWFSASGALTNFVLAFVIFVFVALAFGEPVDVYNRIGAVTPGKPAAEAGIKTGDWVLSVDGKKTYNWTDVVSAIEAKPEQEIKMVIGREAGQKTAEVNPYTEVKIGDSGKSLLMDVQWPQNEPDSAVFVNIDGDYYRLNSVESVDGIVVKNWEQTAQELKNIKGKTDISFKESLDVSEAKVTPYADIKEEKDGVKKTGKIGIGMGGFKYKRFNFFESIWIALQKFWMFIVAFVAFFGQLFRGQTGDVQSIVGIVSIADQFASLGIAFVLGFTAMISMNLGFINLIPFPGLDGSKVVLSLFEGLTGKKLPRPVENVIHAIGFILLMALIALLVVRDILRLI